jgi:hypothetical protein
MEKFSSDRTIHEYAEEIWELEKVVIPAPSQSAIGRVRSQPHLMLADERLQKNEKRKKKREATIIKNIDENELHNTLVENPEEEQGTQFLDS